MAQIEVPGQDILRFRPEDSAVVADLDSGASGGGAAAALQQPYKSQQTGGGKIGSFPR